MPKNTKVIDCIFCKRPTTVDNGAKAVLCARCVQHVADPPQMPKPTIHITKDERLAKKEAKLAKRKAKLEAKKTAKRGRGKGWHLKKLFEFEGQFYSLGKEITDAEAAKIKKSLKKDA